MTFAESLQRQGWRPDPAYAELVEAVEAYYQPFGWVAEDRLTLMAIHHVIRYPHVPNVTYDAWTLSLFGEARGKAAFEFQLYGLTEVEIQGRLTTLVGTMAGLAHSLFGDDWVYPTTD